MGSKLAYIVAFGFTFLVVTGVLMHLNNFYQNIWKFDFTVVTEKEESHDIATNVQNLDYSKIEKLIQKQIKKGLVDTLRNVTKAPRVDTVYTKVVVDKKLIDSMTTLQREISEAVKRNQELVEKKDAMTSKELEEQNAKYDDWIKKTAKMYEAMDPKKASKIITKYSDNIARDILYKMKQKKAAEILAVIDPEVANRITRVQ